MLSQILILPVWVIFMLVIKKIPSLNILYLRLL